MLSQGAALPSDALARTRVEAIQQLKELYRTARTDGEKRRTEATLFEASRTPSQAAYSNELLVCILENSATIVEFFSELAPAESYEILQTLEHKLLWMYRRNQGIAGATGADAGVARARDALNLSIPAIPISRSRRSRSPIPIDPDQCGAVCVRAPLDAFRDLSVACRCQVRREPVPVVSRRDPRATRSAPIRRVAACAGGAC